MRNFYLLEARSGLPNWYGCPRNRMRKLFNKNLFFAEQTYGVRSLKTKLKDSSFRIVLESSEQNVHDFKRFLIAKMNYDIQSGSKGIDIFSGGVDLHELPSYGAHHASDLRSHTQPTVDEVHHPSGNCH